LQPVELQLLDGTGKVAAPFDERTVQKFDTRVTEGMYKSLAPGAELVLQEGVSRVLGGSVSLLWGPYRFGELAPGSYRMQASWESGIDWVDDVGGRRAGPGSVWKGRVIAPEIGVALGR